MRDGVQGRDGDVEPETGGPESLNLEALPVGGGISGALSNTDGPLDSGRDGTDERCDG